mgnify:CR=1 FL=1
MIRKSEDLPEELSVCFVDGGPLASYPRIKKGHPGSIFFESIRDFFCPKFPVTVLVPLEDRVKTFTAVLMSLLLVSLIVPIVPAAASSGETTTEAQAWLKLIDAGNSSQSWRTASGYFRTAIPEADWTASLQAARAPLGAMIHRKQTTNQEATSLPGAPDGAYRILTFSTEFAHKKDATETVTLMREPDGQWRATGYFIK